MNDQLIDSIPYVSGAVVAFTTTLAQVAPDNPTMWINAGVAGLFALFMLRVIPTLLSHMRDTSDRHIATMKEVSEQHEKTIRSIVGSNERKDQAWQQIVQSQGECPYRGLIHPDNKK